MTGRASFVLTGGASSRMGRDKALLAYRGRTLVEHVARMAEAAAGRVTLVGHPERYGHLGFAVIADAEPGLGPLGGIRAALGSDRAGEWNLIAACDMPDVSAELFTQLFDEAELSSADAVIPLGSGGLPEPLCAVYHERTLPAVDAALACGIRKVTGAFAGLAIASPAIAGRGFRNVNSPEEWSA